METKTSNATNRFAVILIAIGPMILGFIWGFYHDLFISHERDLSFLFYTLAFSLSYIPTFIAISDVQKRQDIEKRPRILWTIALYFTWIFGASIYLAVFYGRAENKITNDK